LVLNKRALLTADVAAGVPLASIGVGARALIVEGELALRGALVHIHLAHGLLTAAVEHLVNGLSGVVLRRVRRASAAALTVGAVPHAERIGHARSSLAVLETALLLAGEGTAVVHVHACAIGAALSGALGGAGNLACRAEQCAAGVGLALCLRLDLRAVRRAGTQSGVELAAGRGTASGAVVVVLAQSAASAGEGVPLAEVGEGSAGSRAGQVHAGRLARASDRVHLAARTSSTAVVCVCAEVLRAGLFACAGNPLAGAHGTAGRSLQTSALRLAGLGVHVPLAQRVQLADGAVVVAATTALDALAVRVLAGTVGSALITRGDQVALGTAACVQRIPCAGDVTVAASLGAVLGGASLLARVAVQQAGGLVAACRRRAHGAGRHALGARGAVVTLRVGVAVVDRSVAHLADLLAAHCARGVGGERPRAGGVLRARSLGCTVGASLTANEVGGIPGAVRLGIATRFGGDHTAALLASRVASTPHAVRVHVTGVGVAVHVLARLTASLVGVPHAHGVEGAVTLRHQAAAGLAAETALCVPHTLRVGSAGRARGVLKAASCRARRRLGVIHTHLVAGAGHHVGTIALARGLAATAVRPHAVQIAVAAVLVGIAVEASADTQTVAAIPLAHGRGEAASLHRLLVAVGRALLVDIVPQAVRVGIATAGALEGIRALNGALLHHAWVGAIEAAHGLRCAERGEGACADIGLRELVDSSAAARANTARGIPDTIGIRIANSLRLVLHQASCDASVIGHEVAPRVGSALRCRREVAALAALARCSLEGALSRTNAEVLR